MRRGVSLAHAAVGAAMLLAACGEKEPSKLTFGEVSGELAKGPAVFST